MGVGGGCERSLAGMKKSCMRQRNLGRSRSVFFFFLVKFPTVSSVETL